MRKVMIALVMLVLLTASVAAATVGPGGGQQCPPGTYEDWNGDCVCSGGPYAGSPPPGGSCPGYVQSLGIYLPLWLIPHIIF